MNVWWLTTLGTDYRVRIRPILAPDTDALVREHREQFPTENILAIETESPIQHALHVTGTTREV